MKRARRARIVATLGPASRAPGTVKALAEAGVDVFRLNFSHGSHEDHAAALKAVRGAEMALQRPLGVLADLQGPKLRLGRFADVEISVKPGHVMRLDLDPTPGNEARVQMPHPEIFKALRTGMLLLIDDGRVRLRVGERADTWADVTVESGSKLSDRKGVAVPEAVVPVSALTPKDREDLAFALRLGVDWVALSFVQKAEDMAELKRLVGGQAACLAKIEKPQALTDLEAILDYCDGVMVARGDLGVELDPEEVPVAQKQILRAARQRGVPAIVATQMLESMTSSPAPTRAEASDVANAVYEGADALMLSAETASGAYPLEAVGIMNRIMERVERDPLWPGLMDADHAGMDIHDVDALVAAARKAAEAQSTACMVVFTTLGGTARRMSRERPLQPVLALTPKAETARRLSLVWGLEPRLGKEPTSLEDVTEDAVQSAMKYGLAEPGQRILILAGTPFGAPGAANLLRLAHAPAKSRRRR
ncbi:pyruvate kinase [Brevundimonas sp. S30B]|uniref:pyruvate kinase n=1 Tax=unclassified Brevundimonas TaxID=2622653 RepID=UPI00107293F8|nr:MULTISPECIES: pyruvate kinase [unclassified Brevundimonas]QBX37415.1 pyruvate kinase [Brevundimonas sp. MF30-B]TFW03792.1 pyruvate kinase [Brevundimonas sp. S30B]